MRSAASRRSGACGSQSSGPTSASGATCGIASLAVTTAGSGSSSSAGSALAPLAAGLGCSTATGPHEPRRYARAGDACSAIAARTSRSRAPSAASTFTAASRTRQNGLSSTASSAASSPAPPSAEGVDGRAPHPPHAIGRGNVAHGSCRRRIAELGERAEDRVAHDRRVIDERVDERSRAGCARRSSPSRSAAAARTSAWWSVNSTRRSANASSLDAGRRRTARSRSRVAWASRFAIPLIASTSPSACDTRVARSESATQARTAPRSCSASIQKCNTRRSADRERAHERQVARRGLLAGARQARRAQAGQPGVAVVAGDVDERGEHRDGVVEGALGVEQFRGLAPKLGIIRACLQLHQHRLDVRHRLDDRIVPR